MMKVRRIMPLDANSRPARRVAVVAVTAGGARLAARIVDGLPGATAFVPARFREQVAPAVPARANLAAYEGRVAGLIARLFSSSDALVLVMACGAAVRLIAPLVNDKQFDPAVAVVDDGGRFAISVLSGHLGGANELTSEIAGRIGAIPVITTASEGAGVPAADLIGREWGWKIEPGSRLKTVAAALVNGETVGIYQDAGPSGWAGTSPPANLVRFPSLEALAAAKPAAAIIISYRLLDVPPELVARAAIYRPPVLVLGIGCSRGAPAEEIAELVDRTLQEHGLSLLSVHGVASIDLKANEPGLLAFLNARGWPLTTYSAAELDAVEGGWSQSETVRRAVGVGGVAEPAALRCAGAGELLVGKVKSRHATVAIAMQSGHASEHAAAPRWAAGDRVAE